MAQAYRSQGKLRQKSQAVEGGARTLPGLLDEWLLTITFQPLEGSVQIAGTSETAR